MLIPHWHIITPEYPPAIGGVGDYTRTLAAGLAEQGEVVHVWCPGEAHHDTMDSRVAVHRRRKLFRFTGLVRLGRELHRFRGPQRILLQWVPTGFGYRFMNVFLPAWLWMNARRRNPVYVVLHEPFLSFRRGLHFVNLPAAVERFMMWLLLRAASHVWVTVPAWAERCRPYAPASLQFTWLPVPSNIPVHAPCPPVEAPAAVPPEHVLGHFGMYDPATSQLLAQFLEHTLLRRPDVSVVLMGRRSHEFNKSLQPRLGPAVARVQSLGALSAQEISRYLQACDVVVQPYVDGVSTRRTSAMAALSHGLPLITTLGSLTEDFWKNSGAVSLYPPDDVESGLHQLDVLLDNRDYRANLGKRARELYENRFAPEHLVSTIRNQVLQLEAGVPLAEYEPCRS